MAGLAGARLAAFLVLLALIVAAPFVVYPVFVMQAMSFALVALGFNLLLGYVGLLSLGHAAFFGLGAYVGAFCAKSLGSGPELAILAGTASGAAVGLVVGFLAIRRQGIYFAMITLALAEMVRFFCLEAPFTHGEDGIQPIPRGRALGALALHHDFAMYWFVAVAFVLGFLLLYRIIHSPFGQVLKAIRESETRAISLGYRVESYKLLAFVLSAGFAGAGGALEALVTRIATLSGVDAAMSAQIVLMVLLGGMGTVFGPVVGALIVVAMQTYLATLGSWVSVIQGGIFIVCVLAFRRGVVGEIAARLRLAL